jgi:hypothetical protein
MSIVRFFNQCYLNKESTEHFNEIYCSIKILMGSAESLSLLSIPWLIKIRKATELPEQKSMIHRFEIFILN